MVTIGIAWVVVAVLLVLAEAHLSTGGLIGLGALVALVGGVVLVAAGAGAGPLTVALAALGACAALAACVVSLARATRAVRRLRPRAGVEAMVGHVGVVRESSDAIRVLVDGGLWRAQPSPLEREGALHDGDRVVVERVNGLTLGVRKAEEWELIP